MNNHATHSIGNWNVSDSLLFAAGLVLVLAGMYLRWKLAYHVMEAEEQAKDGWLDEAQARRRASFLRYGGPAMILLGAAAFVVVLWR